METHGQETTMVKRMAIELSGMAVMSRSIGSRKGWTLFVVAMDARFHIRKSKRKKEKEKKERKSYGWKRLLVGSGAASSDVVGSGATSNGAIGSDAIGNGATSSEKGSIVGIKIGNERKENVKKKIK